MDNNSDVIIRDKFRSGCVYLFKSWTAFRIALDKNPQILSFYNESHTTIEINEMLDTLYNELYSSFSQFEGQSLKEELSECLFGFIVDYFQIYLEDQSEEQLATEIIELYDDLSKGQMEIFNRLKVASCKVKKYEVDFPIEGNQKVIFERDSEDDEDAGDEDEDEDEENKADNDNEKEEGNENKVKIKQNEDIVFRNQEIQG